GWEPRNVGVEVSEAENRIRKYRGICAVSTLPLGVLQSETRQDGVMFLPDLPEKRKAIRSLKMGAVIKAVLHFRSCFWQELGASMRGFLHVPGASFMTWWPLGDTPVV